MKSNSSSNKENENFSNSNPKLVEIEAFSNHLSSNDSKDKKSDNENNKNNSNSNSNEKENEEIQNNNNKEEFIEDINQNQNNEIKKLKNQRTINYELTDSIIMENKKLIKNNNENKIKLENDDRESVHEFYLKKLNYLSNLYNFSQKYISIIILLFKKFVEPFYSKISFIYVNNIKPNLKYFKDLSLIFQNFINTYKNVNNQMQNSIINIETETNTTKLIKKVSNVYQNYINNMSMEIKNQTINLKTNLKNFEMLNGIYEENFKKMLNNISKIEHRKLKCENLYKKNYEKIFENFKNNYKKENFDEILINMDDFLIIEYNLVKYINKLYLKISIFINNIKNLILNSKENFFNLLSLLEICFKIFYNENNLILKETILNEFGNLNDLNNDFSKEKIDKELSIFNIIQKTNSNENKINEFNKTLLELKKILNENINFVNNEKIKIEKLFDIENFKNIENFLDFLLELVPNQNKIKFSEHFYYNSKFKRNPGFFKSWKNCFLVITYQGHVIVFDEDNNIENNISNKNNDNIDLDNDKLIFFIYNKNKIEINIKSSKKNKYIFSICEIGMNKKKVKNIILDALSMENLQNVIKKINNTYEEEEYF